MVVSADSLDPVFLNGEGANTEPGCRWQLMLRSASESTFLQINSSEVSILLKKVQTARISSIYSQYLFISSSGDFEAGRGDLLGLIIIKRRRASANYPDVVEPLNSGQPIQW
ncbi:unnamed protein product [Allacma fusca]|uniref:Uncharacterized protein n=1 Tax=Allacma fusca TaxID=39272 RepID=A0A8J2PKW8_9HEXA|nr:unnamed protein product [Allacma fusca]